jgi:hypothetical protein
MGRGVTSAPESPGMEMLARLPVSPMRSRGVRGVALGSMSSCTLQYLGFRDYRRERVNRAGVRGGMVGSMSSCVGSLGLRIGHQDRAAHGATGMLCLAKAAAGVFPAAAAAVQARRVPEEAAAQLCGVHSPDCKAFAQGCQWEQGWGQPSGEAAPARSRDALPITPSSVQPAGR